MSSVFKRLVAALLLLAASLTAVPAGAASPERFAEFLRATQSGKAEFEQKIFDGNKKLVQESRGTFLFQRPGKFRWTYVKPYAQLIVGDGARLWIYDEDLNQVTVRKLDQALGSTPAALLSGNNEVIKAFKLTDRGTRDGLEWLEAAPRDTESNFDSVRMGFGFSGLEVMELHDSFGQTTVLKFTTFQRNPPLDAASFRFTPPKGADVIGDEKPAAVKSDAAKTDAVKGGVKK
jgi:outer membrane lipoprotein carrier protein